MNIEIVRDDLSGWAGRACLVRAENGHHFVVSSVDAMFTGFETLVFRCDPHGEVRDMSSVAGGRGWTRDEALDDLRCKLDYGEVMEP